MKFKPKSEDSRNFLKLKDGETVTGVFRGDLFEYRMHWADSRAIICQDKTKCELCLAGKKSTFRFRVNFVVKEGDNYSPKIFEQGWTIYEVLRSMNETDYDLEKYAMKITRRGIALNTVYSIIPVPNGMVRDETEKKLSALKLNDLGHVTEAENEPHAPAIDDINVDNNVDDIPF